MKTNWRILSAAKTLVQCTGCGTCVGVCPLEALQIRRDGIGVYLPVLDARVCNRCGLCRKVCPGGVLDMIEETKLVFDGSLGDPLLGNFLDCYIGHSTDPKEHFISASGGLASALAKFALEAKIVDGVAVTRMSSNSPLEPTIVIAHNAKEVESAAKSKYCPVPLNVSIRSLSREKGRFALVGLPCHIHGIRKAERLVEGLKSKVILHIGLFCGHTVCFAGTEFLLERFRIPKKSVTALKYREGFPSKMTVEVRSGTKIQIPMDYYWGRFFSSNFFTPVRCTLCPDFSNELADLSLGDAWLPELANSSKESLLITRTKMGENFIEQALMGKRILIKKIGRENVVRSCKSSIAFKKKGIQARLRLSRALYSVTPRIVTPNVLKPSCLSYATAILTYLDIFVSTQKTLKKCLLYIPDPVIRLYSIGFRKLNVLG